MTPRSVRACHADDAGYDVYERAACEVIVDWAAHVVYASIGLDASADTIPYIAGWAEAITPFASVIDELARIIEEASLIPCVGSPGSLGRRARDAES